MSATFVLPRQQVFDANGLATSIGSVRFFLATTTTPKTVYSDTGLLTAINQPIQADSAGRLPKIYIPTGLYKTVYYSDAAGTLAVYTEDNCDTGIPAGSGALPVANGGTGATTAAGARTNLAAASQTDLNTQAAALAVIQAAITALPGSALGQIAGLSTLTRAYLAAGFGSIVLQAVSVATSTTQSSTATTIPLDDTIPQNTEGAQVLIGNFTPISASSVLEIEVGLQLGNGTSGAIAIGALFKDTDLSALCCGLVTVPSNNNSEWMVFTHRMASPGTSAISFKVRVGSSIGTTGFNGTNTVRQLGGSVTSYIRAKELLAF